MANRFLLYFSFLVFKLTTCDYFCLLRFKNEPVCLSAKCARPRLNSALLAAAARHAHAWGLLGNAVDQDGGFASDYGDDRDDFYLVWQW